MEYQLRKASFLSVLVFLFMGTTSSFAQSNTVVAVIDASETHTPISEHIYGQFIEHIGDIVNDGIWAEMLDSRKFYAPILDEKPESEEGGFRAPANRWIAIGSMDALTLDSSHVFTGEHSPRISASENEARGFWQDRLSLLKGKEYTGRIVLAGEGNVTVEATLVWGEDSGDRQSVEIKKLSKEYQTYELAFMAGQNTTNARLEITGTGEGAFWVGAVSLMPGDNVEGFRKEVIALLKSLNSGVYRFPGGNFVSGHEWRHAIGDRDKRPPIKDPHWGAIQPNDVGTDEFLTLSRLLDVEPYITVNAGFGDAWSAKEMVEYVNGSTDTRMGKMRAENGHPKPYNVKFWGVGNEAWGSWQMGAMSLDQFVIKHNLFAKAMLDVDPSIKLIGSGAMPDAMTCSEESLKRTGKIVTEYLGEADWTGGLFQHSLHNIDIISEHFYAYAERRFDIEKGASVAIDPNEPLTDWMRRPANHIKTKVEAYHDYLELIPELKDKQVPIALAEWAYSGTPSTSYKVVPAYAWGFHEMIRYSDLYYMANFTFATSLMSMNRTDAILTPTGELFKLYANHFGTIPVTVSGNSPQPEPRYPAGGQVPKVHAGSTTFPLDVVAAYTKERAAMTIAIINPSESEQTLNLSFEGVTLGDEGTLWRMAPDDLNAKNVIGEEPEIVVQKEEINGIPETITFKPHSVNLYKINLDN
jgi:alpha-N-arabinofuranosidase